MTCCFHEAPAFARKSKVFLQIGRKKSTKYSDDVVALLSILLFFLLVGFVTYTSFSCLLFFLSSLMLSSSTSLTSF